MHQSFGSGFLVKSEAEKREENEGFTD